MDAILTPREIADNRWAVTLRELNADFPTMGHNSRAMIANDYCSFGHREFADVKSFMAEYYPTY